MNTSFVNHSYIFLMLAFTVYSQLVMRWQVLAAGGLPDSSQGKISFIFHLLINPWVISGIVATFLAGVSWMLAMTKLDLSYAYPFVALNYVLILALGFIFFQEVMTPAKILGSILIVAGVVVLSRG